MAAASTSALSETTQKNSPVLPLQKKLLQDVLECIIQLKADFFEHHQPITDDSVVLQRFCAKFEHLLQAGMKEKSSLLGRKKDYWDYFCECLQSVRGSNDGIRYVKSLAEHKTSLGRGRAFIRFCLVHQRLADTLQQCVVHDKTKDWFVPSSVFMIRRDCENIISSLYDLNSLHFDLSPKGYDLDTNWPSFSNRKPGASGTWSVPISRRSSITSMDTVSQISISVDNTEVDRLTRDLEVAQNTKSELIGQIDTLQQEKEQVNQSAWATQGELQALRQQLAELQSEHMALQERYKELDITHMKMKLESEHNEKHLQGQLRLLNEKFREEEHKRVSQLEAEEQIWKKEVKEEGERKKREIDRLQKELEVKTRQAEMEAEAFSEHEQMMKLMMADFNVTFDATDAKGSLSRLGQQVTSMRQELKDVQAERTSMLSLLQGEQSERDKTISHQEGRILELSRSLRESQDIQTTLHEKMKICEQELKAGQDSNESLQKRESGLQEELGTREREMNKLQEELATQEREMNKFQEELKTRERDMNKLQEELETQEKEMQEELTEALRRVANLEMKSTDLITEKDELCGKLQQFEDQNTELQHELSKKEENLELSRKDRQEVEQKLQDLQRINDETTSQLKEKENQLENLKAMFESGQEEMAMLKLSLEGKASEVGDVLEKKDEALAEVKAAHADALQQLQLLKEEVEDLRSKNLTYLNKLSTSESQISLMNDQKTIHIEQCVVLEKELNDMKRQGQDKENVVKEKGEELCLLRSELASVREGLESVISHSEKLKADLRQSNSEKEALRVEVKWLQTDKERLKLIMDAEKVRVVGLLKASEGSKVSEEEKEKRIAELMEEIDELKNDKERAVSSLEQQIKSIIDEKNQEISTIRAEIENLKTVLENEKVSKNDIISKEESKIQELSNEKSEAEVKLKEVIMRLETEIEEMKQTHETETVSYSEKIANLQLELAEKARILSAKSQEYEATVADLNKRHLDHSETSTEQAALVGQLQSELAQLAEEKDQLSSQMKTSSEEAQELKSQVTEISQQLEKITVEKESFSSEFTSLHKEFSRISSENSALEIKVNSMKDSLKVAEDETQEKLSQKREVELQLENFKQQLSKVMAENQELGNKLEEYESQTEFSTKVLEEHLVETKDTVERLKTELMELQDKLELVEKERDDLAQDIEKIKMEKEDLFIEVGSVREQTDFSGAREIDRLKEELRMEREKNASAVESLEEEVSALQFQLSAEKMIISDGLQAREVRNEDELNIKALDLEFKIEELEKALESSHRSKEADHTQVNELKKQLLTKQEECEQKTKHLLQVESKLNEEASRNMKVESDLRQLRQSYSKDVEEREEEIKNLQSDNEQIKKKLIKLIRDKDTLWHKTDQLMTEKKWSKEHRWQDSTLVTHCLQCKTEFSLFVRKHHCRMCGKIFCWTCSDFWIDSPHSSKKIRTCKPCFDHDTSITSLQSTSLVDMESDDSAADDVEAAASSTYNQTDEGKMRNRVGSDLLTSNVAAVIAGTDVCDDEVAGSLMAEIPVTDSDEDVTDDSVFQIIDQEAVIKSISAYSSHTSAVEMPPNMTSSMVLLADDLKSGEVNKQNEVWIKPGKTFIVPVDIERENTVLHWEFTSQPKDIVFSVNYRTSESTVVAEAEEIVAPCKCDSHRQTVRGELTAKQKGIYSLVFDNTYSRMTSKKVHYSLEYKKLS